MARFVYFHFLLCFFYQMCVHTLCQMHLCLCLRLCVCVCGGCPAFVAVGVVNVCVCVCGSGRAGLLHILQLCALKTCLLDISRHSHWARSTCRTYKAAGVFQGVTGYGFGGSRGQRSCSHWAEECNNTWNAAGKTERSDRHFFSRGVHNNKLEIIPKWC